jgi:class 3 adenylate cyclase
MIERPETWYATAEDGTHLAYLTFGEGPVDLLWIHGFLGGLEIMWENPLIEGFSRALASFARLIRFDLRGTGLSDRAVAIPDLETQIGDMLAVLDAVGSHSTVIAGAGPGTFPAVLFASTHPNRTRALCLWDGQGRMVASDDYPWGYAPDEVERDLREVERSWGTEAYAAALMAQNVPSRVGDRELVRWYAKVMRHWVSPGDAVELLRRYYDTDVREILPTVRVPTLVLAREWDDPEEDRFVAAEIPGARLVRIGGHDPASFSGDHDAVAGAIRSFLGLEPAARDVETVLQTVLFTDIVASTELVARVGDRAWKDLIERHHGIVREQLARHRGIEVDTAGDGFYANFDGPARAIHCALAVVDRVRELGLEVRAGLHTGECELIDGKCGGLTVTLGARVAAAAGPGEVLVSRTLRDLVAGSGFTFADAGEQVLKGVPEPWRLYRVVG